MVPVPPHERRYRRRRLPPDPETEPTHEELVETIERGFREINDRLDEIMARLK